MIKVIGAIHLDVIGNVRGVELNYEEYIGNVDIQIGGQGYNIIICLAALKFNPTFITYVAHKSIIREVLTSNILEYCYPIWIPNYKLRDGVYLGIYKNDKIIKSIIDSPLENIDLEVQFLTKNLTEADSLILDGNCSIKTLINSVTTAKMLNIHSSVCVVNDKKVYKIVSLVSNNILPNTVYFVTLNSFNLFKEAINSKIDFNLLLQNTEIYIFDNLNLIHYNKSKEPSIYENFFTRKQQVDIIYRDACIASIEFLRDKNDNVENLKKLTTKTLAKIESIKDHDITEDISLIHDKSKLDPMTGLLNKEFINKHLESALRDKRASSLCWMMLDIDKFKQINDTKGHGVGDEIIIDLSENLKRIIRSSDFAGRIGGDEFLLVFINCNKPSVEKIYNRILKFSNDYTCSIGVVLRNDNKELSLSEALQLVDTALYKSKEGGRNRATLIEVGDADCS